MTVPAIHPGDHLNEAAVVMGQTVKLPTARLR